MDRLFFDTNVVLDVLEKRPPWFPEALSCLARADTGKCTGAITALTLSDIAYIQRGTSQESLLLAFHRLRSFLDIAGLDRDTVDRALEYGLIDIEDGFQLAAAHGWEATHLLTRNTKDFPKDQGIQILTPSDYLAQCG